MANALSAITAWAEPKLAKPGVNMMALAFLGLVAVGLGAGAYAFIAGHHHVYATTREVPWGILISSYAYFAIISTGLCVLAAISHAFGGNYLAPLANRAVFLSIITIMSAFICIGVELESPHRMLLYNIISPNFSSNIWWMGTLYGLAVGCMFLEFFAILTANWGLAAAIGAIGALAEVGANSNLGAVFATLSARPFWYGAQLPVFFLCSAVMTGAAALILFTHIAFKLRGEEMDEGTWKGLRMAGKIMALTLFLIIVATIWRFICIFTGGNEFAIIAANNLLSGNLSINFWVFETVIGLVLPLLLLVATGVNNIGAMSAAALMTLVGGFFQRYDLVINGQLVPVFYGWDDLPAILNYFPSPAELLIVMGGASFTIGAFLLGERYFGRVFAEGEHH